MGRLHRHLELVVTLSLAKGGVWFVRLTMTEREAHHELNVILSLAKEGGRQAHHDEIIELAMMKKRLTMSMPSP